MTATEKMKLIARHLDNKKAREVTVLKVSGLTILADYFVICSAPSTTQVRALADSLEETMETAGEQLLKKEGKQGLNWILLDYSDVIVHIFYQETREFYGLEKLWADAEELPLDKILEED
ncbi:MAG: ribosome silencing factor [Clostridia bacterium]